MKQLNNTVGSPSSYWHGYEAPSTAFLTTDLAQLSLGQMTESQGLEEHQGLPDLFDLLVKIEAIPTESNPSITLRQITRNIFQGKLSDYRYSYLSLVQQSLIRVDGIIRKLDIPYISISGFKFRNLSEHILLDDSTDALALGGFWELGCEMESIRQYDVTFYEADGQIRFRLHPKQTFIDYARDRKILFHPSEGGEVVYESIDVRRHGNYCAWITFRIRNTEISE